jgi:SRSO17 transposase
VSAITGGLRSGFTRISVSAITGGLRSGFTRILMIANTEQGHELDERSTVWLLIEWRDGEADPANYYFSSMPQDTSLDSLVAITTQRWRTERAYQDLKGELGLDHYEGRKFRGWHHHISVVLSCYAFAVAERHRIFPLQSRRPRRGDSLRGTA